MFYEKQFEALRLESETVESYAKEISNILNAYGEPPKVGDPNLQAFKNLYYCIKVMDDIIRKGRSDATD